MDASQSHEVKVITVSNGGAKSRRATCGCGFLGVRFAYAPKDIKIATAKATADGERHVAEATGQLSPTWQNAIAIVQAAHAAE